MRVLLVDDDLDTVRLFAKILAKAGFDVVPAKNGQDALEEAAKERPDIVLSDILMPVMDGYTLCRVWKANSYLNRIPFIFYSGVYKGLADQAYARTLGASAFIPKPVDPAVLLETIRRIAGGAVADLVEDTPPGLPPEKEAEPSLKAYDERLVQRMKRQAEDVMESIEALRESEARYRQLVEMSPDPIAVHCEGKIVFINPAGFRLMGAAKAEDVVGRPVMDVVHPDSRPLVAARVRQMSESGQAAQLVREKFLRLDGTPLDVDVISAPVTFGGRQAFQVIVRDVSEQVRAEQEILENHRFHASIFSGIQDGLCTLDRDLTITLANPTMEKWYAGAMPLAGKKCYEVYHGLSEPCQECPTLRAMETRLPVSRVRERVSRGEATGDWVEISAFPRLDPRTGEVAGAIEVIRDITERRRAEEALRESERRLAEARSLETVGLLAQGLAHEVRNPLFTIDVNVAALARQLADDQGAQPFLSNIHEYVRRLDTLMKDILELSRPMKEMEFLECGLHDILLNALNEIGLAIPSSQGRVYLQAPDPTGRVLAAPNQLTQVFLHLIANALQNSPPGGRVFIRLGGEADGLVVRVSDEGQGIPESVKGNLFEPFMTTHPGRKGLGLALARHYLRGHGGTISAANNDPPPGATFTVRLPAAE